MMKKKMLLCGIMCLCLLSACGVKNTPDPLLESDYLKHDVEYRRAEDQDCLKVLVQILTAVDHKDRDELKQLFSKDAINTIPDLDEKLDVFIETFPTWEKDYDTGFGGVDKHANNGVITRKVMGDFDFFSDGREYVLYFEYYTDADQDPDLLGLSMIQIYERYMPGYSDKVTVQGKKSTRDVYLWDYSMELKERKPLFLTTPFEVYEKSNEDKMKYIKSMSEEEKKILLDSDERKRLRSDSMYSHEINIAYLGLHEYRFVENYLKEKGLQDQTVIEGVSVNYFDISPTAMKGDFVTFHYIDDERKRQYNAFLDIKGDQIRILNEDELIKK